MSRSAGAGFPLTFRCSACRQSWACRGGCRHTQSRTGRTRRSRATGVGRLRGLPEEHEYVCGCGHTGWSHHYDVLRRPLTVEAAKVPGGEPADRVYALAVAAGTRIDGCGMDQFEPCTGRQADYWLIDNVRLRERGVRSTPDPTEPVSVSIDPCGGPAVQPIRWRQPDRRRVAG